MNRFLKLLNENKSILESRVDFMVCYNDKNKMRDWIQVTKAGPDIVYPDGFPIEFYEDENVHYC